MTPFVFWVTLTILLVLTEIFTTTFFLLCMAIGAIVISVFEFLNPTEWEGYFLSPEFLAEIVVFSITSGVFMTFLPGLLRRQKFIATSVDSAIGKEVIVLRENGKSVVKFESQSWRIDNENEFKIGEKGVIREFRGTKVFLEKQEQNEGS